MLCPLHRRRFSHLTGSSATDHDCHCKQQSRHSYRYTRRRGYTVQNIIHQNTRKPSVQCTDNLTSTWVCLGFTISRHTDTLKSSTFDTLDWTTHHSCVFLTIYTCDHMIYLYSERDFDFKNVNVEIDDFSTHRQAQELKIRHNDLKFSSLSSLTIFIWYMWCIRTVCAIAMGTACIPIFEFEEKNARTLWERIV